MSRPSAISAAAPIDRSGKSIEPIAASSPLSPSTNNDRSASSNTRTATESTALGAVAARPALLTTNSNSSVTTSTGAPNDTTRPPSAPIPDVTSGPTVWRHTIDSSSTPSVTSSADRVTTSPEVTTRSGPASATAVTGTGSVVDVAIVVVVSAVVDGGRVEVVEATVENVAGTVAAPGLRVRTVAATPISRTIPEPIPRPMRALR